VDTLLASARDSAYGLVTGEPNEPRRQSWGQVHEQAMAVAGALAGAGIQPGSAVAVLAAEPAAIGPAVQGAWLAGGAVTMLHQPTPRTDLAVWAGDTVRVLGMIGAGLVALGAPFEALAGVLDEHGIAYRMIDDLTGPALSEPVEAAEDDTALLQLTSGATATPKAVRITHGNLIANIRAMSEATGLGPGDVMVSWLPIFHDMGMVGFFTVPMTLGIELVKITPVEFMTDQLIWPRLLHRYSGTITAAPNFAYAMVGRRMASVSSDGEFDLSRVRIALNGAEPVDQDAVRAFTDGGARFGMPPECVLPAYGMAEVTLAVSFTPPMTGLAMDRIDARALERDNRAAPSQATGAAARAFPLLGYPVPGLEVHAVDERGARLGDRQVGELRVRGEAVTPGYLTVDGPLAAQDAEGWLATGDLGYLAEGQVVVCGRIKDVIIAGGRNIYPTDIERAAGAVDGVRAGNAAAVRLDAGSRRERFAVAVESQLAGDAAEEARLVREVTAGVVDAVGARPRTVVVLGAGELPKTPSGKLRRVEASGMVAERLGAL
jgi:fatty-acyl-CoA synthase